VRVAGLAIASRPPVYTEDLIERRGWVLIFFGPGDGRQRRAKTQMLGESVLVSE
jgi:hypothetical protein